MKNIQNDGGNEMVTVIEVYTRGGDGSIVHRSYLGGPCGSTGCAGCAATHDSPAECGCEQCMEGRYGE